MKKTDKSHIYQNYQRHLVKATVTTNNGINNFDRLVKVYGADANRIELLNKLRKQSKFTIYWFLSFVLLGAVCLVLDFKNSWFNIFDLYILMVNIYLVARGKLAGMYIGVIECLFYAFICYNNQLYGEVIKVMCISIPRFSIILTKPSSVKRTAAASDFLPAEAARSAFFKFTVI